MVQSDEFDEYAAWLRGLADERRYGADDRRGSVNLIDRVARQRAAHAIESGEIYSLCRPLAPGPSMRGDDRPAYALERFFFGGHDDLNFGSDHLELDPHGHQLTHLDALNHVGVEGTWYGGRPAEEEGPSIADMAGAGLLTRGVLVDVPAARGVEWVSADQPVTGEDIEAAFEASGVQFSSGDALLVYMGRDKYELAGQPYYEHFFKEQRPGIGRSGARWIAEHDVAMLAWDFNDANHPDEPSLCTHRLLWAIGLALVDNCDFSYVIEPMRSAGRATGAFCVAPLPLVGATGCNVNPLLVL